MQLLNINDTHEVESYPYGRLRCKAFFSIEFKPGKGFRTVFQTINPKNNRVNNPKKSTYYELVYQVLNPDNGHIENKSFSFYEYTKMNEKFQRLATLCDELQLTPDMISFLCDKATTTLLGNFLWSANDKETRDKLYTVIAPTIKALQTAEGKNIFASLSIDFDKYNEIKATGEPVKFVTTQAVSLSSLA